MQRTVILINLAVTGSYISSLIMHVVRPGQDAGYTRMLMFACVATIPIAFLFAMIGGQERWPVLLQGLKQVGRMGASGTAVVIGVVFLLVVLPSGMLIGVWFGMGMKSGTLFLLFFVPLVLRLTLISGKSSINLAVHRVLLYFGAFVGAIALVRLLTLTGVDLRPYEQSVQTVWPGYGHAAIMFFAAWLFALAHHATEFRHALMGLFNRG